MVGSHTNNISLSDSSHCYLKSHPSYAVVAQAKEQLVHLSLAS